MTYLYLYVISSYIIWYFLMIRDEKVRPIGKMFFWYAPVLLPIVIYEKYLIGRF